MYYRRTLRLINTEVQKTFYFCFLWMLLELVNISFSTIAVCMGVFTCIYTPMWACIHMIIYVYIWRLCGGEVHLLNTYLLDTSLGCRVRYGNRNVNKAPWSCPLELTGHGLVKTKWIKLLQTICAKCCEENKQDAEPEEASLSPGKALAEVKTVLFLTFNCQYLMLRINLICAEILFYL